VETQRSRRGVGKQKGPGVVSVGWILLKQHGADRNFYARSDRLKPRKGKLAMKTEQDIEAASGMMRRLMDLDGAWDEESRIPAADVLDWVLEKPGGATDRVERWLDYCRAALGIHPGGC
jgi:hypothetical protein